LKIWIVCTGEGEGLWPKHCSAAEFEQAASRRDTVEPEECREKKISGEGRLILVAPTPAARKTAELCVNGGELREEPLLAPVEERAFREVGSGPLWLWRQMARIQRAVGSPRQPESRRQIDGRAEELFCRLEQDEKDCVLVADCLLTERLLDRARIHGCAIARTGVFRYRPWERVLVTRRNMHCGGCGHNCLLTNPGCGIGRDKAARHSG
jgi:hypothetical protein